jgi:hypothetical protein
MVALLSEEAATVWRGGKRRYFTRKAAAKAAAREIIKAQFRATGDDPRECEPGKFVGETIRLGELIASGKAWAFDFETAPWVSSPDPASKLSEAS